LVITLAGERGVQTLKLKAFGALAIILAGMFSAFAVRSVEAQTVTNTGAVGTGTFISGSIIAFSTSEGMVGQDLNGDGDTNDYVVRYFTIGAVPPIDNIPPVANAGPDQTVYKDALVTFNGSASYDNVGIVSYEWTFMDVTPKTLTGVNPTYTFTTPCIYTATLTVSDAAGNHATDTVTITVLNLTSKDLTQRLLKTIENWKLPKGTENSLTSKLKNTLHLLDIGNKRGATNNLECFINEVKALQGKKLTNGQANYLISEAQRIINLIKDKPCNPPFSNCRLK
jgi:PKD repeat protein